MSFFVCLSVSPYSMLSRSIKRIIFNSLVKPNINEKGEKQMETISTSQALQISGRAGRSVSLQSHFFLILKVWKCLKTAKECTAIDFGFFLFCRFSSKFKEGEVTTMHRDDLPVLKEILSHPVDPIEVVILHTLINHTDCVSVHHVGKSMFSNLVLLRLQVSIQLQSR